jgi:hypothetical protein
VGDGANSGGKRLKRGGESGVLGHADSLTSAG